MLKLFRNFKQNLVSKFIPLFILTKNSKYKNQKKIMFGKKNFYSK